MDTSELNDLLDSLESKVNTASPLRTKWQPVWDLIRTIGASFKSVHYPTVESKQEAWHRFQSLVQRVKDIQAEERERREQMISASERHKDEILACASAATPPNALEEAIATIVLSPIEVPLKALVDAVLPGPEIDETRELLKYCSKKLSEGWHLLSLYKQEMLGRDKKEALDALKRAQELLDAAWSRYKSAREEARRVRQETRGAQREAREQRIHENISNLKQRLERLYGVLEHKESHLEQLRPKRDSARTDDFRARVEGWIDEEEESIRDIRAKIERIETWMEEERSKL